jgi:hypothetical protein
MGCVLVSLCGWGHLLTCMHERNLQPPGPRALAVMHRERKCRGSERVSADGFGSANLGRGTGFVDRNKAEGGSREPTGRMESDARRGGRIGGSRWGGHACREIIIIFFFKEKSQNTNGCATSPGPWVPPRAAAGSAAIATSNRRPEPLFCLSRLFNFLRPGLSLPPLAPSVPSLPRSSRPFTRLVVASIVSSSVVGAPDPRTYLARSTRHATQVLHPCNLPRRPRGAFRLSSCVSFLLYIFASDDLRS